MPSIDAASEFLDTLNGLHPSMEFTMELPVRGRIPFIGIEVIKSGTELETQVYRKQTNSGHSHTDKRYKVSLVKTMLHRAYALCSTTQAFILECNKLRSIFSRLDYPRALIDSIISNFVRSVSEQAVEERPEGSCKIRIILPFKDQVAANAIRRQFHDLSNKIRPTLEPVFVSRKLENDLKPREVKPSIVNQQCVVYHFSCDLCDADYVGYTARHLVQHVAEHKNSAIGKHFLEVHGNKHLLNEGHFKILRKCQSKFDCLIFEMLFIKKIKPCLNTQVDSIRAKLFV